MVPVKLLCVFWIRIVSVLKSSTKKPVTLYISKKHISTSNHRGLKAKCPNTGSAVAVGETPKKMVHVSKSLLFMFSAPSSPPPKNKTHLKMPVCKRLG